MYRDIEPFSSLVKRDIFTFVPGISDTQYNILTKAYTDAIFLANNALNPPLSVDSRTREWIFNKYFPPNVEDTVLSIYDAIVGDDSVFGNKTFSHLLVDVHDSNGNCERDPAKNYVNREGSIITICPNFWDGVGDQAEKECSELPQEIVSWQMTFPGDTIFNLLIGFAGQKAIDGKDIVNWQIDDARSHTGAANAMYIRFHTEDTTILSAMNYNWYALVSHLMLLNGTLSLVYLWDDIDIGR